MRYVVSKVKIGLEDKAYRIYVTDALKVLGGLNVRYVDLLKKPKIETRSKDEIVESIRRKLK